MKRVQKSGAKKRQLEKEKQQKLSEIKSKIAKMTNFYSQTPEHAIKSPALKPNQDDTKISEVPQVSSTPVLNQPPSSEMGINATSIALKPNHNDIRISEMSQINSAPALNQSPASEMDKSATSVALKSSHDDSRIKQVSQISSIPALDQSPSSEMDINATIIDLKSNFAGTRMSDVSPVTSVPTKNQSPSSEMDRNAISIVLKSTHNQSRMSEVSEITPVLNQSPSSEMDINATIITLQSSHDDDIRISEMSQASSITASVSTQDNAPEMIQSANKEMNTAKDPGLWLDFSVDDVAYWIARGPTDCQHHNGPFDKSCRHFVKGKPIRYCSPKLFIGKKANGEEYKREWLLYSISRGSVYCFVCKLFAPKNVSHFATKEGFSDWRNTAVIDNHEKSKTHRDCMLTYLTRRQGLGLDKQLENQIQEECNYWEHVLRRVIAVIRTLSERGLAFRGTEEKFGSLKNGNFLGLLELISEFDPFLASHIAKYGNCGKGNPSYLSKTICEELIELMAQKVHAHIIAEIKSSVYFSLSVDSTPDLSHIDQLSVIIRYLKDGEPIERFITFLEMKSHIGEEMANQVLKYLSEDCQLNFSNCRGQSYDNAANMSGCYKGMQQKILEVNKFAIYVPCAAHSLNLVGRYAVDCCREAVNFFSIVQLLYTFFSASCNRWKILKNCIGDESILKSLSDTRWEAHSKATEAIFKSYSNILDALECITEDDFQKGDTRRDAENLLNKMQELEFVFMLNFWNEVLQSFHRVSQVLQKETINLKTCADLYGSLVDQLIASREQFEKYETKAKEMLPGIDYRATKKRKRVRKKMPNDGDAPEVVLTPKEKFRVSTFYKIIDILESEMRRRREIYKSISECFSFLSDIPKNDISVNSSSSIDFERCCQKLIDAYPNDLNISLSDEIKQFHMYVRHKYNILNSQKTKFSHAELYKIIVEDDIQYAFPNVDIAFRIFLTLMVTNCTAERSFSHLKHIKNPMRTTMTQNRLDSLSVLNIEADVLRKIDFEDLVRDFANKKCRRKFFKLK